MLLIWKSNSDVGCRENHFDLEQVKIRLSPFSLNSDILLFTKELKLLNDNLANLCLFRTADVGEIGGS